MLIKEEASLTSSPAPSGADPEITSLHENQVNINEVKPGLLEEAKKLSALPSPADLSKFDALVVRVLGGITITLPTENGLGNWLPWKANSAKK